MHPHRPSACSVLVCPARAPFIKSWRFPAQPLSAQKIVQKKQQAVPIMGNRCTKLDSGEKRPCLCGCEDGRSGVASLFVVLRVPAEYLCEEQGGDGCQGVFVISRVCPNGPKCRVLEIHLMPW